MSAWKGARFQRLINMSRQTVRRVLTVRKGYDPSQGGDA